MTKKVYVNAAGEAVSLNTDVDQVVGVKFTFDDGATEIVEFDQLDAKTQKRLTFHGISQKVGDSYASASASSARAATSPA